MTTPATLTPAAPRMERRHDLDALRAIAMLLGIALHAAISFIPQASGGWAVQDTQTHLLFGIGMALIHGFRMPLFFLVSGFFTMMLWRKRGLAALLSHRAKRILLPMLLSLLTIIPVTWAVSIYISHVTQLQPGGTTNYGVDNDLWQAAFMGDLPALRRSDDLPSLDVQHPENGATPLSMATWNGHVDAIDFLLQQGADVNARNRDGSTALHAAAFLGRSQAARRLLDAGADPGLVNDQGERPADALRASWGVTRMVAGWIRVSVDQTQVEAGRRQIAAQLGLSVDAEQDVVSIGDDSVTKRRAGALFGLGPLLTQFPLWGHLWFLWFLCWYVLGFAISVGIARLVGAKRLPTWLTLSATRYLWLIPLTAIPQYWMSQHGTSFGPETSVAFIPAPVVLVYYALFFAFGAVYFDAHDDQQRVGRWWWLGLPIALLILFPLGLFTLRQEAPPVKLVSAGAQASYAWLMTFGLMGLFRERLSRQRSWMRYLSDASYWLYLAHIPLVIYVQYWVRDWAVSPFLKFPLVCIVVSLLLLVSYQLLVRHTPLGTLLNGPRKPPPTDSQTDSQTQPNATVQPASGAALGGVKN